MDLELPLPQNIRGSPDSMQTPLSLLPHSHGFPFHHINEMVSDIFSRSHLTVPLLQMVSFP